MSPSSKVQMCEGLLVRGRGVLKLGLMWCWKTKLWEWEGKFLIDFSRFFFIVAQKQYYITLYYYVKKRKEKIKKKRLNSFVVLT